MQWSDVIKAPSRTHLRQFAGLCLIVFGGMAAWRWTHGRHDTSTMLLGAAAVLIGIPGMIAPALVRPIYTGWMIAAFPIGWTVSRVILGAIFYVVITPIGLLFRFTGRDAMRRARPSHATYWTGKAQPGGLAEYLRQF
jgi:hypothetical protein